MTRLRLRPTQMPMAESHTGGSLWYSWMTIWARAKRAVGSLRLRTRCGSCLLNYSKMRYGGGQSNSHCVPEGICDRTEVDIVRFGAIVGGSEHQERILWVLV